MSTGFIFRLKNASLRNVSAFLQRKTITPVDLLDFCYQRALYGEKYLGLNCFTQIFDYDTLMKQAVASTERYKYGERICAIDGIPISVKANVSM